jgi:cytochrome c-type biogenesis protein CcmH
MTLWFLFALMTAAAVFAVLWPLGRARRAGPPAGANDVAVYRDQIDEITRDRAAGLIGEAEAEAAHVEVSRRLLAAADAASTPEAAASPNATARRRVAAVAVLLALPALAAGIYLTLGAPQLPGQPLAQRARTPLQERPLDNLVAQVEAHLEKNPDDARGWEVIAPVYMRLGRFDDAVKAWRNALRISGATADREANLGEALMGLANGIVTGDAKAAFDRALAQDPKHLKARFFLGVAAYQDGRNAAAAEVWRAILADVPPASPWGPMLRQSLAQVEGAASAPAPSANAPSGPSAEDVAAAEKMSPQDRAAMVQGMVERLAERLKRDGSDVEGWLRLVRAYTVMGDRERALSTIADARRALGHDADKLRRLDELVRELKLES